MKTAMVQLTKVVTIGVLALCNLNYLSGAEVNTAKCIKAKAMVPVKTNPPELSIDGNEKTRWSADGKGRWLKLTLENPMLLNAVSILWFKGDQRQSFFELELSMDGKKWVKVIKNGASSGQSKNFERYTFDAKPARYVKFIGNGNSTNVWISLYEIKLEVSPKNSQTLFYELEQNSTLGSITQNSEADTTVDLNIANNGELLPYRYEDKDGDGFPDGYEMHKGYGHDSISYVENSVVPTIKIVGDPDELMIFKLKNSVKLGKGKKYLFSVEVKIDKINCAKDWQRKFHGVWPYLYGLNNRNKFMAIGGNGSSKDWITVMMPFNTIGERNENLMEMKTWFRIDHTAVTFYARNPMIIELDANSNMESHYLKSNRKTLISTVYNIK